jgi:hypothetical protein
MLSILFGSTIGILSILTVVGAVVIVGFWLAYWIRHQDKHYLDH